MKKCFSVILVHCLAAGAWLAGPTAQAADSTTGSYGFVPVDESVTAPAMVESAGPSAASLSPEELKAIVQGVMASDKSIPLMDASTASPGFDLQHVPSLDQAAAAEPSWDEYADGWHFRFHPNLWMSGMKGTVGKGNRTVNVDASFSDLVGKLEMALVSDFEIGNGPVTFLFNGMWFHFGADGSTPRGRISAHLNSDFAIVDGALAYKFFDKSFDGSDPLASRITVEVLGGARWQYLSADVKLKGGILGGTTKNSSVNWVDPYVGLRGKYSFTKNLDVALMGTWGGFDVGSEQVWSASGQVDYRFTRNFAAFIGYKILSYDYDLNAFTFDAQMQGPFLGVTLEW